MKEPIEFQNQAVWEVRNDSDVLLVAPDHGARLLRWTREGREVIHWPDAPDWSALARVRGGNPVLFPFLGRHMVDGKIGFWRDESGTVRELPMHGFARDEAFAVVDESSAHSIRMRLVDNERTRVFYPFSFQFDVVYTLHPGSRLETRYETTNLGEFPLPYYAGHHFYFALPHGERDQWFLHLPCVAWGRQTPEGAINRQEPEAETLNLADPSLVDRFQIEPRLPQVVFAHGDGVRRLVIELEHAASLPWYAVTTWTEKPDSDFYCVEPWLGLPNAIHHGAGLRWLKPGQTEIATCILDAGAW